MNTVILLHCFGIILKYEDFESKDRGVQDAEDDSGPEWLVIWDDLERVLRILQQHVSLNPLEEEHHRQDAEEVSREDVGESDM